MVHQEWQHLFFVDDLEGQRTSLAEVPEKADGLDEDFGLGIDLLGRLLALLVPRLRGLGRGGPFLRVG